MKGVLFSHIHEMYPIWMGKTHNDVVKDGNDEYYQIMHVQRWLPFKK
jgi:hypothetical protein